MSSRVLIALYFLAAFAFGLFIQLRQPFATVNAATIGGAVGTALAVFVISAIIPAIFWLIGQFRPKDNRPFYNGLAVILWAVFGLLVAYFMEVGDRFSLDQEINRWASQTDLKGKDRDDFFKSAKFSCVAESRKSEANSRAGVTEQQINAYCNCHATNLVNRITMDEMKYMVQNGHISESMNTKISQSALECSRTVLLKK